MVDRQASRAKAYGFVIERISRVTRKMLPPPSQIPLSDLDALARGLADPSHQLVTVLRTLPGSVVTPEEIDEHLVAPFVSRAS